MELALAQKIAQAVEATGLNEAKVREDYSGRGMYGNTTAGVYIDGKVTDVLTAVVSNADMFVDQNGETIFDASDPFSFDSMGHGTIIY